MPKYAYKVITETGNTGSGVIEADSPDSANNKLTAMGYIPTRVKVIGAGAGFDFKVYTRPALPDSDLGHHSFHKTVPHHDPRRGFDAEHPLDPGRSDRERKA